MQLWSLLGLARLLAVLVGLLFFMAWDPSWAAESVPPSSKILHESEQSWSESVACKLKTLGTPERDWSAYSQGERGACGWPPCEMAWLACSCLSTAWFRVPPEVPGPSSNIQSEWSWVRALPEQTFLGSGLCCLRLLDVGSELVCCQRKTSSQLPTWSDSMPPCPRAEGSASLRILACL